jgi:hypothetical protein
MLVILLTIALSLGAEPAVVPAFKAHTVEPVPVSGTVQKLESDGALHLSGPRVIAGADLVSVRQENEILPSPPAGPQVQFAGGDRMPGKLVAIKDGKALFRIQTTIDPLNRQADAEISIPLDAISVMWLVPPPERLSETVVKVLNERRRRDVVLMNNGDIRNGTIRECTTDGKLTLTEGTSDSSMPLSHVVALAMNTDLARTMRPSSRYYRLVLRNGARISFASAAGDDQSLNGKLLTGATVVIPWSQILSLETRQGAAAYLSDLKPKNYEHTPFFGLKWPYTRDRSVVGNDLRLAGHCYDKGLGMHSQSKITFALDGKYRRFETLVGLDDRTGQGGSVRLHVLLDGQEKAAGDELTSVNGPRTLQFDCSGAKELTLVVEFGNGGDVRDHVNWAEARLIK